MAVTIKDVAAAAGVSPSTVSRTCKDSPSISRDTKERVRRIMAQLGYEPNFEAEPVEAFSKTKFLSSGDHPGHRAVLQPAAVCEHGYHRAG